MNRIESRFQELAEQGRKGLIPFLTAGDPEPDWTVTLLHALVESGADIVELGVPFSDPLADGPAIQRASERALEHRVSLLDVLEMVREFRRSDRRTPVVLMGYAHPIERLGPAHFAERAAAVGVDGVLTVDMPPEEGGEWLRPFPELGLAPILLATPTTSSERLSTILKLAHGFLYYVSITGVTGADSLDAADVVEHVAPIRSRTELPLAVGFGIRDADAAAAVASAADAVVVGSALVRTVAEHARGASATDLEFALRRQMDQLRIGLDHAVTE